jgi:hypothetical protein
MNAKKQLFVNRFLRALDFKPITVKLGYNELGFNEHSVITNKNIYLVGLGHFYDKFSRL